MFNSSFQELKGKGIKNLSQKELKVLSSHLCQKIVRTQNENGFLGSCLGVVDLTVAINYVFDTQKDQIFWDVGHQIIPHLYLNAALDDQKIISKDEYSVHRNIYNRPGYGLSESIGALISRDLKNEDHQIISIIGDRSLSSGQSFEALNHLGVFASKMIVILNDNMPEDEDCKTAIDEYLQQLKQKKNFFEQHSLFESLGFNYIGPIDGHDFDLLLETLQLLKKSKERTPVILHIKTKKGKGYAPAEADQDGLNSILKFNVETGVVLDKTEKTSGHFACDSLIKEAAENKDIALVTLHTPHMQSPFLKFKERYPDRYFEVGVTESHAITLASSLAQKGLKPYLVLYSSFLHRVLDHSVIDICLKNIPVRFIVDHTRFTGHDFPHEARLFDSNFLSYLPNLSIMAPGCGEDIEKMIQESAKDIEGPCVIRLSKTLPNNDYLASSINRSRLLKNGRKIAILSYGGLLSECVQAAQLLDINGFSTSVTDVRFLKPLDTDTIRKIAKTHSYIVSVEENAIGSFANHILHFLNIEGFLKKIDYLPIHVDKDSDHFWSKNYTLTSKNLFQKIIAFVDQSMGHEDYVSVA